MENSREAGNNRNIGSIISKRNSPERWFQKIAENLKKGRASENTQSLRETEVGPKSEIRDFLEVQEFFSKKVLGRWFSALFI
jgi:hypothetical protein